MKALLALLLCSLPALAGFAPAQLLQTVHLAHGQNAATVVFCTTDGSTVEKARALCNCMTLRPEGTRLVAQVDTSTFDATVDKQIKVTTSDGQRTTLTMRFEVPQPIIITPTVLLWERGAAATPQEIRLSIPPGSPIRALLSADLSGDDFDYTTRTLTPGREYAISVAPRSTAGRRFNRLVIKMDGPDPRYRQRILYLRVR